MEKLQRYARTIGVLGLFALVIFGSLYFYFRELTPWVSGFGVAAGVLLAAYAALDRDSLQDTVQSRSFIYGSGSGLMVILVGAIGLAAYSLAERHDERWDMTGRKRFSVSDQTLTTVAALDRDVEIVAFFGTDTAERRRFEDLVKGYTQANPRLKVRFVDPMFEPLVAQEFTVTTDYGTVVLVSGEDRQRLEARFDEEALTNALVRLASAKDHTLCWSTGHGEPDPDDDRTETGLGVIVLKLEDLNYTVRKLQIASEGVPRECEALVVVRPSADLLAPERESIAAYVAEGGRALFLLDPTVVNEAPDALADDLRRYGLSLTRDVVLDADRNAQIRESDPSLLLIGGDGFGQHPITGPLKAVAILAITRSVSPVPEAEGLKTTVLLRASPMSWGEKNPTEMPLLPNEGEEVVGQVPIAVAVEVLDPGVLGVAKPREGEAGPEGLSLDGAPALDLDPAKGVPADFAPKAGGRVVVIGDTDFANNTMMVLGNNQDLFLNTVAWLVNEQAQLGERPEAEPDRLALSVLEERLLWLVSIFLVPGAAIALAAVVMLRRRYL
jgi:ABC-type uncharacterized transport system involved in gliding motility auxiliary subunit